MSAGGNDIGRAPAAAAEDVADVDDDDAAEAAAADDAVFLLLLLDADRMMVPILSIVVAGLIAPSDGVNGSGKIAGGNTLHCLR